MYLYVPNNQLQVNVFLKINFLLRKLFCGNLNEAISLGEIDVILKVIDHNLYVIDKKCYML